MRRREKPSARRAATSPRRWFTDTVRSVVTSRKAKNDVMVDRTNETWRKYENSPWRRRSRTSSVEKGCRSGRRRRMAATAPSVPAPLSEATSSRSASSGPAPPSACAKPASVTAAMGSVAVSNGNSTTPATSKARTGRLEVTCKVEPGSAPISRAIVRLTTICGGEASARSAPRRTRHSPRRRVSVPMSATDPARPSVVRTETEPKRTGTTSSTSGSARRAAVTAADCSTGGPSPGRTSVAVTRTS
jgi:hypothetical protein